MPATGNAHDLPPRDEPCDLDARTGGDHASTEAGEYAVCRHEAAAMFALEGNAAARDAAYRSCTHEYERKRGGLEVKAVVAALVFRRGFAGRRGRRLGRHGRRPRVGTGLPWQLARTAETSTSAAFRYRPISPNVPAEAGRDCMRGTTT